MEKQTQDAIHALVNDMANELEREKAKRTSEAELLRLFAGGLEATATDAEWAKVALDMASFDHAWGGLVAVDRAVKSRLASLAVHLRLEKYERVGSPK